MTPVWRRVALAILTTSSANAVHAQPTTIKTPDLSAAPSIGRNDSKLCVQSRAAVRCSMDQLLEMTQLGDAPSKQNSSGSTSSQHSTVTGSHSERTMAEWAANAPTPADFLGLGQTVQQLLAAQIDASVVLGALGNTGGGRIPCGHYRVDNSFPVRNGFIGAGSDCVTLQSYVVKGDIIVVPPGATNLRMGGFKIWSMVPQIGGAAIHIQGGNNIHLDDITTAGSPAQFHTVYQLDQSTNTTFLNNFLFTNTSGPCIQLSGTGTAELVIETHISHGVLSACEDGILINSGSGLYLDDVDSLGNANVGIRFAINADSYFFGASIHNSYADSNVAGGITFECGAAGCGPINQVTMTNIWASGSGVVSPFTTPTVTYGSPGIHVINPKTDGLVVVGGQVRANGGHGVAFDTGRNLTLNSVQILQNAFFNNTFCGVFLGIPATKVSLMGNIIGPGGVDATPLQGSRANGMASAICRPTPEASDAIVEIAAVGNIMTGNLQVPLVGSRSGDVIIGPSVNGVSLNVGW